MGWSATAARPLGQESRPRSRARGFGTWNRPHPTPLPEERESNRAPIILSSGRGGRKAARAGSGGAATRRRDRLCPTRTAPTSFQRRSPLVWRACWSTTESRRRSNRCCGARVRSSWRGCRVATGCSRSTRCKRGGGAASWRGCRVATGCSRSTRCPGGRGGSSWSPEEVNSLTNPLRAPRMALAVGRAALAVR